MKKIIALLTAVIMCMTISGVPAMAMEIADGGENVNEVSVEAENTIQPRDSAAIIYPQSTTFSITSKITQIRYQGFASNNEGFIEVRFTNLTNGYVYNRVFVTDGCVYRNGANMEPGNYKIETTGGTYGVLSQLFLNFN